MNNISHLIEKIELDLEEYSFPSEPAGLYDPLRYFMKLGGKRLRPALTYLGANLFDGDIQKLKYPAIGIELFHNFSLIHDDIMDGAELRRGKATVHSKWNLNTGVLSGDALLVESYKCIAQTDSRYLPDVLNVFSTTAQQVCEGQQLDVDFENRIDVTEEEYIKMIQFKTSVLLGCSLMIGAILSEANPKDAKLLYDFGLDLGTSFQLKDDYLDAFGDPKKFGKRVGGDIISNKKTLLLLKALNVDDPSIKDELLGWLGKEEFSEPEKVEGVKDLFIRSGADQYVLEKMNAYYNNALSHLDKISVAKNKKEGLFNFAKWLHNRDM